VEETGVAAEFWHMNVVAAGIVRKTDVDPQAAANVIRTCPLVVGISKDCGASWQGQVIVNQSCLQQWLVVVTADFVVAGQENARVDCGTADSTADTAMHCDVAATKDVVPEKRNVTAGVLVVTTNASA